jgi:hypothetical protein
LLTGTSAYRLAAVLSRFGEFDVSEVPRRTARRGGTDTHCAQPPNLVPEASNLPTRLFLGICLAFQLKHHEYSITPAGVTADESHESQRLKDSFMRRIEKYLADTSSTSIDNHRTKPGRGVPVPPTWSVFDDCGINCS